MGIPLREGLKRIQIWPEKNELFCIAGRIGRIIISLSHLFIVKRMRKHRRSVERVRKHARTAEQSSRAPRTQWTVPSFQFWNSRTVPLFHGPQVCDIHEQ